MMGDDKSGLGIHRVWLQPFEPKVMGGLRGMMNQNTDPTTTILTPKKRAGSKSEDFGYIRI